MTQIQFEVVGAGNYYTDLLAYIPKANKRIVLSAMTLRSGPRVSKIMETVVAAAQRGVQVLIVADRYAFYYADRPDYLDRRGFKAEGAMTHQMADAITKAGGVVHWIGARGPNIYAGRYHAKVTVIDDHVFSFGGVNLTDDAFERIDYVLHTKNQLLATQLTQLVADIAKGQPTQDVRVQLDTQHTLLFDAGNRGTSVIYDRACALTAQATSVQYISQMCPTGQLANHLKNTDYHCYFNRPSRTGWRADTLAQLWDNWRWGITNSYHGSYYIHAKCMLFELKDGSKALISGSHNFSWRGVAFGTKEIALESTDPALWKQLQSVVHKVATDN